VNKIILQTALATAVCFGHFPGKFQFNQQHMRGHLIGCLEKEQFMMLQVKKEQQRPKPVRPIHSISATDQGNTNDSVQSLQTFVSREALY